MTKRQLPGPIPVDNFEPTIRGFEEFIGSDWLWAQPPYASPLTEVWNRTDYLSSLELYTVADSYRQMAPRGSAEWFASYREAIRAHDSKKILSDTYELVTAALFSYGHDARLCPPSHPGYDFTISSSGKTARVSCKKLGTSDEERAFRQRAQQLYESVRDSASRLGLPSFQMALALAEPDHKLKLSDAELRSGVTRTLATYGDGQLIDHRIGGWRMMVKPLYQGPADTIVDRDYASHQFICFAPFSQDEQWRFGDRFEKAAKKLKALGGLIDNDNVNMVMIGLPLSVSFAKAREWLNKEFARADNTSVSVVMLSRFVTASARDMSETNVYFEYAFIPHPRAIVKWEEFKPEGFKNHATVPIGNVIEVTGHATESYPALNMDGKLVSLGDMYIFQRGEIYLQDASGGGEMKLNFPENPGIHYYRVMRIPGQGAIGIKAITPPDNSMVLL